MRFRDVTLAEKRGKLKVVPGGQMMKRAVCVMCLCIMLASPSVRSQTGLDQGLSELSQKISNGLTENQKRTIAVVEFADLRGNVTDFGRFIAEELITRLYETKKFKVIERQLLNKIVAEQKLSLTGIIDQTSAQKLGRLLGVDAIASGTVTDLGKTLRVNARLIDTSTAEIFAVARTEVVKDEAVTKLMAGGDSPTTSQDTKTSQSSQQRKSKTQRVEAQFFTFELERCRLSGTTVACELTITNNERDRRVAICVGGVMFDEFGNQYKMYNSQLANDEGSSAQAYLISGVATKARVTFESVSPNATRITLLSLRLRQIEGVAGIDLQYRNIPLRGQVLSENDSESGDSSVASGDQSNRQASVEVSSGRQWTDSGIDVEPGMKLAVTVTGSLTARSDNRGMSDVLSGVLKQRVNLPPSSRTIGPKALLARIRYRNGGESKTIAVGEKNTLLVEAKEYGRLYFGVDNRYTNSNGAFAVTLSW